MNIQLKSNGWLSQICCDDYSVPFTEHQGFFVEREGQETQIPCCWQNGILRGEQDGIKVTAQYKTEADFISLHLQIENTRADAFVGKIGFHTGVDSWMERYPQWHTTFFPTLLRCEKTHMWGYYMNTAGNALAIATSAGVASYDIGYNRLDDGDFGHRICGTDILFIHDGKMPDRHPQNLNCLPAGSVYENTLYFIPVKDKAQIVPSISRIAGVPMVQADKYTLEAGEKLAFTTFGEVEQIRIVLPDGSVENNSDVTLQHHGLYKVQVTSPDGKQCEASFYCRPEWDFYLKHAGKEALAKPQKATTHVESFYGLFSAFLAAKQYDDSQLLQQALESANEILPLMFDFQNHKPIVIPERIQNTALLVSLLVDMYEATGDKQHLLDAAGFADWLIDTKQGDDGVYRKDKRIHYTCVIYIAKGVLELALAEKDVDKENYQRHYASAKRAVDELVASLDNIDTEGEATLEDGMISCSALQIGMFALTLPEEERKPYIDAAEKMMAIHACLEQQIIPDCRCSGASLRYWESQYDLMVMANMLNSPHGWSGWTAYAHYYLYRLTHKKQYLTSLMNCMGSCAQLMSLDGELRWGYCCQPFVEANTLVPDINRPLAGGGFRGKYEQRTYGECYIPMISDWYRTDKEKLVGGYEWCALYLEEETLNVDNQGGCCDNDVHEIFKCMEETVLGKAFAHRNEDGTYLTYGCKVQLQDGQVHIVPDANIKEIICNFQEDINK